MSRNAFDSWQRVPIPIRNDISGLFGEPANFTRVKLERRSAQMRVYDLSGGPLKAPTVALTLLMVALSLISVIWRVS